MCYYNGIKVTHGEFVRLKHLEAAISNMLARDLVSGFEYSQYPVLKANEDALELTTMEWGFLPTANKWPFIKTRQDATNMRRGYKDAKGKFNPPITTLNATAEEMLGQNKMYRDAGLKRRCLVLSSGFYEWRHIFGKNKKTGEPLKTADKFPYHIYIPGQEYFYMAGIYNPWTDQETGETVDTFAIITTEANSIMRQIHNSKNRMPTILNEDLAYEWLFENPSEERIIEMAKTQFPASKMSAHTIQKDFREALDPTTPFDYGELVPTLTIAVA
jgi:putative SOS response-associated peptidase YedK